MFDILRFLSAPLRLTHPRRGASAKRGSARLQPRLELLEDRCLMTGIINDYAIPSASSNPLGIVAGTNGLEWFTESGANNIASINTTTQAITEYPVTTQNASPAGIAVDNTGNIWFTEQAGNNIGEINTTTHVIAEFPIPTDGAEPEAITVGPNGSLWFTETGGNKIGEINPSHRPDHRVHRPDRQPAISASSPRGPTAISGSPKTTATRSANST